tara:strand:- start:1050 stop:1406 length:357 start_codon:yes stop_codon:yes gene_type:complete
LNIGANMGVSKTIYQLDDGQRVSIDDVMQRAQIKMSAARYRLSQGRDPAKVLAKKGKQIGHGYSKTLKKRKPPNKAARIQATFEKRENRKKTEYILKNHPFYDTGETGRLHRILFGKW